MIKVPEVISSYINFQLYPTGVGSHNLWSFEMTGLTDHKRPYFVAFYYKPVENGFMTCGDDSSKGQSLDDFVGQTLNLAKSNGQKIFDVHVTDIFTSKWRAKNRSNEIEKVVREVAKNNNFAIPVFTYEQMLDVISLRERFADKILGYLMDRLERKHYESKNKI